MSEITVRRGGKIVRVTENELDKYLTKGYEVYGSKKEKIPSSPVVEEKAIADEDVVIAEKPKKSTAKRTRKQ